MSRKKHSHLRGQRGQAFADRIRGIPLDRILCVSIDIHKYFHVVIIHNALGEIVTPRFEIDIFQSGFDQLCREIDQTVARTRAQSFRLSEYYTYNSFIHNLGGTKTVPILRIEIP